MAWRPFVIALMIGLRSYAVWQLWRTWRQERPSKWFRIFVGGIRRKR